MKRRTFPKNWVPKKTCEVREEAFKKSKLSALQKLFPTNANGGKQRDSIIIEDAGDFYNTFDRFLKLPTIFGVRMYLAIFGDVKSKEVMDNDANCLTLIFTPTTYSPSLKLPQDIEGEYYTVRDKKMYKIQSQNAAQQWVENYGSKRCSLELEKTINSTDPNKSLGDTRYLFYDKTLVESICKEVYYQISRKPRLAHGIKIAFTEHINNELYASRLNIDFLFTDIAGKVIYIEDIDDIEPEAYHLLNMDMATPCPPGLSTDSTCTQGTIYNAQQ